VLKHYWPNSESFTDITKTDFTKYANKIDILTGGFPCQPYSQAGKRKGKEDERHLWPEMLRAIREISPRFVVGENVRGLTNWNGGLVFEEVCAELESYGYQVAPCIIPACGVDAPHRRERVWFVAYADSSTKRPSRTSGDVETNRSKNNDEQSGRRESAKFNIRCGEFLRDASNTDSNGFDKRNGNDEKQPSQGGQYALGDIDKSDGNGNVANPDGDRLERGIPSNIYREKSSAKTYDEKCISAYKRALSFEKFPTQSPICSGDDGFSTELDGITFSKWRAESIKAYGNAIVPQVAYQIFKAIQLTNENTGY
jgi:DNA (cytosine-5)-methyltransferase 1